MEDDINTLDTAYEVECLLRLLPAQQFQKLLEWLLGHDPQRALLSEKLLVCVGPTASIYLIARALAPDVDDSCRRQLLSAVDRLGLPMEMRQWFQLNACRRRFGLIVKAQIETLLRHNRQGVFHTIKTFDAVGYGSEQRLWSSWRNTIGPI